MANVMDYLQWRGDLTFEQSPFNPVDNLILCCLSYVDLPGAGVTDVSLAPTLAQISDSFFAIPDESRYVQYKDAEPLLKALAQSPRFRDLKISHFVNTVDRDSQCQFSAFLLHLPGRAAVVYRGTDSTLAGWKEDFNLSFMEEVPAQRLALAYLALAAKQTRGELLLCGHSKGGNLAIYAAANCDRRIQRRIAAVYNNDGPGFNEKALAQRSYLHIADRLHTFVPQSSVVGLLLAHEESYTVVYSGQSGIMQHDPYSWQVQGADFVRLKSVTDGSRFLDHTLKDWLSQLTDEQRARFTDVLYGMLVSANIQDVEQLTNAWFKNAWPILQNYGTLDRTDKALLSQTFKLFTLSAKRNLPKFVSTRKQGGKSAPQATPA